MPKISPKRILVFFKLKNQIHYHYTTKQKSSITSHLSILLKT